MSLFTAVVQLSPAQHPQVKFDTNYCKKNLAVYNAFKDDIRQLADLKQQISQKDDITLQHIATMSLCCEVISSFVMHHEK